MQASFGFNFGALGARPAKQSSLPPQRSSRRTPVRTTPRGANGSAQRHRSASIQRSSSSKPKSTPKNATVTPQLGKRKRGSPNAFPNIDDDDEDELSPNRDENVPSVEKSRRVVGTVSPIREEADEEPDELSIIGEGGSTVRKTTVDASAMLTGTPVSVLAQNGQLLASKSKRTPVINGSGSVKASARKSVSRRSKLAELPPATPGMAPNGRLRTSAASRVTPKATQDESEDELSPQQVNESTSRVVSSRRDSEAEVPQEDAVDEDVDELSSPVQQMPVQQPPAARKATEARKEAQQPAAAAKKRSRPRRALVDEGHEASSAPAPVESRKRGRPAKVLQAEKAKVASTPAAAKSRRKEQPTEEVEEDEKLDELSPDKPERERTRKRGRDAVEEEGESDTYEEPEPEPQPTTRPAQKRPSPQRKQQINPTSEKAPSKRHKLLGPKRAISVMRIKGSTVRGITVADTTRTILEDTIDHRLSRMVERLQTSQDSAQRKELRSEINMSLSFKESLNEKLLDLQDANDVLSSNFKKMKIFKRDNAELRKDILALQNSRQETALEHDDVQAELDDEKSKVDARNKLSEDMFAIEAAIQEGRTKARQQGRENEGPQIPLDMLLGMVGRDVGSFGGSLLSNIKNFNGALERAAGWLEGRA